MNKDEPKLKEWVNNWVSTNQKNGNLNTIYKKYHGRDLPGERDEGLSLNKTKRASRIKTRCPFSCAE